MPLTYPITIKEKLSSVDPRRLLNLSLAVIVSVMESPVRYTGKLPVNSEVVADVVVG